jgi:hypothetical protein
MANNSEDDLKKAIAFLLEKEMRQYSVDKKKEFLLKKVSPEIVEKALDLYPLLESNMTNQLEEFKKYNKKGFLDSFFDIGVISSVLLATLGINYLIDLNRNKKNELFYKDIEKKINEELKVSTDNMNNELKQNLSNYVVKDSLNNEIHSQIQTYAQEKGLSLNLSSKSIKENITKLNTDMSTLDKKSKELSVKIDNNNLLFRQDIMKEFNNIIEENNKKLLYQIIENQNRLIMTKSEIPIIKSEIPFAKSEPIKIFEKPVVPNEIQTIPNQEDIINTNIDDDFHGLLEKILTMFSDDTIKNTFLKQLSVKLY